MINKTIIFAILLVVILGGAIAIINPMGFSVLGAGGFTVTSISTTKVISNEADLHDTFFLINTVANGGGQSIVGTITPEETKQFTSGTYETIYPLEISMSAIDETVDVTIQNLGEPIYKWSATVVERPSLFVNPTCPATSDYKIEVRNFLGVLSRMVCVTKVQSGTIGRLSQASVQFRADITMKAGSESYTKTISSSDSSVAFYSGSNLRGTAQWTGSLVTGDGLPSYSDIVPIYWQDVAIDQWRLLYTSDINNYNSKMSTAAAKLSTLQNDKSYTCEGSGCGINLVYEAINEVNTYVDMELKSKNVQITQESTLVNKESINAGKVRFTLDRRMTNPNILFKVKADWVGVKIGVGKPRILSVTCPTFNSGEIGAINVNVMNAGTASGTFAVDIYGCDPFDNRYSAETNKITLDAGDDTTLPVQLSTGTANSDTTKTCTVKLYDYNLPSSYTTASVSCTMKKASQCVEGKIWVDGDCIKKCEDQEIITTKCCDNGVIVESGVYDCSPDYGAEICDDGLDNDKDGLIDSADPDCKETTCELECEKMSDLNPMKQLCSFKCWIQDVIGDILNILKWIGIAIGAVIIILLIVAIINQVKNK